MNNFTYLAPTKMFFGIDEEKNVGKIIKEYGFKKVMLHYGKKSIFSSGLYDVVTKSLKDNDIDFIPFGGVEANPTLALVKEGVELARKENIDFILAVGGGSVIDSAKSIAHGYFYDGDPFDFNLKKVSSFKALKIGVILTIAAAGSEMSNSCVISDLDRGIKTGFNSETNRPLFCIMDPKLTYTVSKTQTAYGVVDIISHSFERYFNKSAEIEFADYLAEGLLKSVIASGQIAILEPTNYDARATLMVASSYSHNGVTGLGKVFSMPIHQLEHELSGFRHDIAHGAGLACLIPAWMKVMLEYDLPKLKKFAVNVMNIPDSDDDLAVAKQGIKALETYFEELGVPTRMSSYGITEKDVDFMVSQLPEAINANVPLTRDLDRRIYLLAL